MCFFRSMDHQISSAPFSSSPIRAIVVHDQAEKLGSLLKRISEEISYLPQQEDLGLLLMVCGQVGKV